MRVVAAMSGGVDSSVAAARVRDAGHDVVGVHLALSSNRAAQRDSARGCCTIEDADDARRAADQLDIPFYVWDLSERFSEDVVEDFVSSYERGETPNPCLRCNEKIKFSALLDKAVALGFDAVATGHYARVLPGPDGTPQLHRAVDAAKDQSYVLAVLSADRLARAIFPLGDSLKSQVRAEAAERGLRRVANKPDSHDICFIPDGDTAGFLTRRLGQRPGQIVDESGAVVGEHDGSFAFTIGQRRGLGLGRPATDGRKRYVLDIAPTTNTVTVAPLEDLDVSVIEAERAIWAGPAASVADAVSVQVRAHGEPVAAVVESIEPRVRVRLDEPIRAVAPGQALALYDGTRVIGSATIVTR